MRRAYVFGGVASCVALAALWSCGLDDTAVFQIGEGDASTADGSSVDGSSDATASDSSSVDTGVTDSGIPDTGPCIGTLPVCDTTSCGTNQVCTPPIPAGWHVTNFIPTPQACDVAYGGDGGGSSVVEITDGGAASCGCDCVAAGDPSCLNAHVTLAVGSDSTCSALSDPLTMSNGCSGLSGISVTGFSEATVSISTTATCTGTVTPTIPTIDGGLSTTCNLNTDAGAICAEHRECVPKPSSGRICIAQAAPTDGGALACPGGFSYSLQTTVASSFSDTRNCSACSCGFTGTGCVNPIVAFNSAIDCTGTATPITQGSCANNGGGLAVGVTGTSTPPTCTQNDGGILDGSTTIVAPETVCCAN